MACPISFGLKDDDSDLKTNKYNLTWRETREGCQDDEKLSHKQQQADEQGDDLRAPFFEFSVVDTILIQRILVTFEDYDQSAGEEEFP